MKTKETSEAPLQTKFIVTTRIEDEFKEVEFLTSSIVEFGITCHPSYRKDGGFKKWYKQGYIISNDVRYKCFESRISDLKEIFKGKFISSKYTMSECKYSPKGRYIGERKATNWKYEIKSYM